VETTAAGAVRAARERRPDLVLLDIGLPDRSGIAVGREILEERPETSVVALTALDDGRLVKDAMRAGFAGYLTKDAPSHQFVRSLESIVDGNVVVSQKFARAANGNAEHAPETLARLTDRERQVLSLLADGAGSETIAKAMSITLNTARTHVQNVLTKLQVHSRLEAATFAARHGLLDPTKGNRLH
jgi:two-component system nitrate/nitrite response regulator NarL